MREKPLPRIIRKVGFDFHWQEEKVWKLKVPAEHMDLSRLSWHFSIPFWDNYKLKPKDVIAHPEKHKEEYARTMRCSMRYPIDIMRWKGRWLILDGLHRLVKAKILGKKRVRVRKIPKSEIPKILK